MADFEGANGWASNANKVIELGLLDPYAPLTQVKPLDNTAFNPTFTYPLFGEHEAIYGYKDLKIKLYFKADSLDPILDIQYSDKLEDEVLAAAAFATNTSKQATVEEEGEEGEEGEEEGGEGWEDAAEGEEDTDATNLTKLLGECLPAHVARDVDTYNNTTSLEPFTPPGTCISTYTNPHTNTTYQIYQSSLSDPLCRKLVDNIQIIVLFLIEGGSTIDLTDEEWTLGRWDVYFLYEKPTDTTYSFVGYCTLFNYYWYSNIPNPDKTFPNLTRSRISQFIILPPYQNSGHGSRLYSVIISQLLSSTNVREITVEDPSEVFEEMRDRNDLRRLRANGTFTDSEFTVGNICTPSPASKTWLETQRTKNKISPRQFARLVELQLLTLVREDLGSSASEAGQSYKLFVKRRLYKHNKDVLSQLEKDERIEKLNETYESVVGEYERIVREMEEAADVGKGQGKGKGRAKRSLSSAELHESARVSGNGADEDGKSNGSEQRATKKSKISVISGI